ncbi:MAG TPA: prepilin peptidase [Chloroflexota bacterium]
MPLTWALVGWGVGALVHLVIRELPSSGALFVRPRCPSCAAPTSRLAVLWGIALIRPRLGRCARCGAPGPRWFESPELPTAVAFGLLALRPEPWTELVVGSVYAALLAANAVLDLRHRYVYGVVVYPSTALALVLTPFRPGQAPWASVLGLAIGVGMFGALYLVGRHGWRTDALGLGDVQLAGMVGAMVGSGSVLGSLALGVFVNGVVAVVLLLRGKGRGSVFPYGPGLCLGGLLGLLLAP